MSPNGVLCSPDYNTPPRFPLEGSTEADATRTNRTGSRWAPSRLLVPASREASHAHGSDFHLIRRPVNSRGAAGLSVHGPKPQGAAATSIGSDTDAFFGRRRNTLWKAKPDTSPTQLRRSGQTHSLTQAAGVGAKEPNLRTRMLAAPQAASRWQRPLGLVLTTGKDSGVTHHVQQ